MPSCMCGHDGNWHGARAGRDPEACLHPDCACTGFDPGPPTPPEEPLRIGYEKLWYAVDTQPLGWQIRAQKFADGPRDDDPPIGMFAHQIHARLACVGFNALLVVPHRDDPPPEEIP